MSPEKARDLICQVLGPGDLQAPYNKPPARAHRLWGQCAVATEALFYGTGGLGPASQLGERAGGPHGWTVWRVRHEGAIHWFLKDRNGTIWDLTAAQFKKPVPYEQATRTFFVTQSKGQGASRRALSVLRRVREAQRRQGRAPMKKRSPNPAWIDTALTQNWPVLAASATPPVTTQVGKRSKRQHADELGCGHYGCVLRTNDPAVVLKITSDPTEAAFVMLLLKKNIQEDGIVHYRSATKMSGLRRGRELFAIWRESAYEVGSALRVTRDTDEYLRQMLNNLANRLMSFRKYASAVRELLKKRKDPWQIVDYAFNALQNGAPEHGRVELAGRRGESVTFNPLGLNVKQRVSGLLKACETEAQMMANEAEGYLVGQALENMLSEGILLADVHEGNIGLVDRPDHTRAIVITDPGHAIFLKRDLADEAVRLAGLTERSKPDKAQRLADHNRDLDNLRAQAAESFLPLRTGNPTDDYDTDLYYVMRNVTDRKGHPSASNASWFNSQGTQRFPDVVKKGLTLKDAKYLAHSLAQEDEGNESAPPGAYIVFRYPRKGESWGSAAADQIIYLDRVKQAGRT